MANLYTKKVWVNDQTKLSARNLNHIENGIEAVANAIDDIDASGIVADRHRHDNKVTLDKITEAFTTELKQEYDSYADKSTVSVSSAGTSETTVKYITINGVEYKLAGSSEPGPTPTPTDVTLPYHEVDNVALDTLISRGVYKVTNATDAPVNTANSGILNVFGLSDDKVEQEWLSDTNRAVRIFSEGSVVVSDFYVDGVKTEPIDGFIELPAGAKYTLSGSLFGTVKIIGEATKYTELVLDGVNIISYSTSAIINPVDARLTVELADQSVNYLTVNDQTTTEETSSIGALESESDLVIYGTGALTIVNDKGHGIKGADVSFGGYPRIYIDAYHDAIHGKSVRITEGTYYIKDCNDAISAGSDKHDGKLLVSGGNITIEHCRENAFQAKNASPKVVNSLIQIYGNTTLTFKAGFSLAAPFNANEVKLFNTITIVNESSAVMPELIDLSTYYGTGPSIRDVEADEPVPPTGDTFYLPTASKYRLKGNFSGYKIIISAAAVKSDLQFFGVYYYDNDETDSYPFIDYQATSKRVEIKLMDNSVNYIHKAAGSCLQSSKNIVINDYDNAGDLFLECPNGYGIYAPAGDTKILNDGARYIENCKVGIYTNYLSLGGDYEGDIPGGKDYAEANVAKKKDAFIYLRGASEADVKLVSRTGSTGAWIPGKIVAPQTNYGITIIDNAIKDPDPRYTTDLMELEAYTGQVKPEGVFYSRQATIYYQNAATLVVIDATSFVPTNDGVVLPVETSAIIGNTWKVYGNYASKSTVAELVSVIEGLNIIINNLEARVEALEDGSTTNPHLSPEGDLTLHNVEVSEEGDLNLRNLATINDDGSLEL